MLLLTGLSGFGQMPEKKMNWKQEPLNWSDFTGNIDKSSSFDANTNSGISYSWSLRSSEGIADFLYKVETFFYPDLSWVKPGKESLRLLAHEQLHFDITELHGRKLGKIMDEFVPDLKADIKKVLEKIYQKNELERRQMQQKYDRETDHGQNEEAQTRWELFIKAELERLKEFSS